MERIRNFEKLSKEEQNEEKTTRTWYICKSFLIAYIMMCHDPNGDYECIFKVNETMANYNKGMFAIKSLVDIFMFLNDFYLHLTMFGSFRAFLMFMLFFTLNWITFM
jgi:hypothetical protein